MLLIRKVLCGASSPSASLMRCEMTTLRRQGSLKMLLQERRGSELKKRRGVDLMRKKREGQMKKRKGG